MGICPRRESLSIFVIDGNTVAGYGTVSPNVEMILRPSFLCRDRLQPFVGPFQSLDREPSHYRVA